MFLTYAPIPYPYGLDYEVKAQKALRKNIRSGKMRTISNNEEKVIVEMTTEEYEAVREFHNYLGGDPE